MSQTNNGAANTTVNSITHRAALLRKFLIETIGIKNIITDEAQKTVLADDFLMQFDRLSECLDHHLLGPELVLTDLASNIIASLNSTCFKEGFSTGTTHGETSDMDKFCEDLKFPKELIEAMVGNEMAASSTWMITSNGLVRALKEGKNYPVVETQQRAEYVRELLSMCTVAFFSHEYGLKIENPIRSGSVPVPNNVIYAYSNPHLLLDQSIVLHDNKVYYVVTDQGNGLIEAISLSDIKTGIVNRITLLKNAVDVLIRSRSDDNHNYHHVGGPRPVTRQMSAHGMYGSRPGIYRSRSSW